MCAMHCGTNAKIKSSTLLMIIPQFLHFRS